MRLNKYIALHTGVSRREADLLIEKGSVSIDGETASLGAQVTDAASVTVNGEPVTGNTKFVYLMLNKPVGYVCSRSAQGGAQTVYDLLPIEYRSLKTVGRLDRDSSGLILLTNDGDYAQQMTHPSYGKTKKYIVKLNRPLEPLHQQMISDHGVNLDDGSSKLVLERITDDRIKWNVMMSEGRNRQIRRTFNVLGYTVKELNRTDFGKYTLGNLDQGKYKTVDKL